MNKKIAGYKLDLAHQTLTLTATFADAVNNPTSAEYKLVCRFKHDYPNLEIVNRTHETPKRYKNSDGSITTRNQFNGLTYEKMEQFMKALPEGEKYLNEYKALRSVVILCPSGYASVRRWFVAQFPKYRDNPLFYVKNSVEVIDYEAFLEKAS